MAGLPCKHHDETIHATAAALAGTPGNEADSPGLIVRVGKLETKTDYLGRWLNAFFGIAAGIIVSLASAAIISVAVHLATPDETQNITPPPAKRPAGQAKLPAANERPLP